ncbi:unnamed protein product [Protopolystoma xenopodis]|uniref:Uncharacterized protein n=1 Tax=Protopolystoma xenopodis TaxID=117903 RepID=A0A3S5C8H6_9PLAT|nr:unnamed protein product [Protopolystoma xenopodis]
MAYMHMHKHTHTHTHTDTETTLNDEGRRTPGQQTSESRRMTSTSTQLSTGTLPPGRRGSALLEGSCSAWQKWSQKGPG